MFPKYLRARCDQGRLEKAFNGMDGLFVPVSSSLEKSLLEFSLTAVYKKINTPPSPSLQEFGIQVPLFILLLIPVFSGGDDKSNFWN